MDLISDEEASRPQLDVFFRLDLRGLVWLLLLESMSEWTLADGVVLWPEILAVSPLFEPAAGASDRDDDEATLEVPDANELLAVTSVP